MATYYSGILRTNPSAFSAPFTRDQKYTPQPPMNPIKRSLIALVLAAACVTPALAASSYWDIDDLIPGAGGATPAGTWDASTANWTTDSTGSSSAGLWTPGDTAIFAAGNDASGVYTVTLSGTLQAAGVTFEEGTVTLTGGVLDFTSGGVIAANTALGVISSPISGTTLSIGSAGQFNLTGANTYSGVTTITTGNVLFGGGGTPLGTTGAGTVVNSGASVLHNVSVAVAEPITINGTGVGGNGALRSTGARTWSGAVTLGSSGASIVAGNNTFTITGAIGDGAGGANNFDLTLGGGGNIRLNTGTFNIGNGIITKEGAGIMQTEAGITAGGINLNGGGLAFRGYSGALNAVGKTITVGTAAGISIGNVTFVGSVANITANNNIVNNNTALILKAANATTMTFSGVISGGGGVDVQGTGSGKVSLNNAETYLGETKVTSGTLQLGASGSIANSAGVNVAGGTFDVTLVSFALNSGQYLKGAGTVSGSVTANGLVAPGNSAGTLTVNGGLSLATTTQLAYELTGNNTTVGGGVNDLISISGNLTLDGTLNVTETVAGNFLLANGGDKWRLINYTGTLTDNGLTLGSLPALADPSYSLALDTGTAGQISLVVVPEPHTAVLLLGGLALLSRIANRRRA